MVVCVADGMGNLSIEEKARLFLMLTSAEWRLIYHMDNHEEFSEDYRPQRKRKKGNHYAQGVRAGICVGSALTIFLLLVCMMIMAHKGYLHVSAAGTVYVQKENSRQGIGSQVKDKLDVIDSLLNAFYLDDLDTEKAKNNIFKAYLASYGDKYTVYYTPQEYADIMQSTTGKFYGIGAVCQKAEDGAIRIAEVYVDSPASRVGMQSGDCIYKIDGTDITEMDLSTAVALIKGDKGTSIHLDVMRDGQALEMDVVRDEIKEQTVQYRMLDNEIGYVYISQFEDVTVRQFKDAIDDLQSQNMKGLVIDIRNNPGGLLTAVNDMLEYVLPDGLQVYTEEKSGKRTEYKGSDNHELTVPYAVLVNGNSASASEIFAGAVQDYAKGKIIGTQTYGKGIVQTIRPMADGSAIKFTMAKYYTPKGQDIHGKGVTPDIVVELDADSETDTQFEAALQYLLEQKNR